VDEQRRYPLNVAGETCDHRLIGAEQKPTSPLRWVLWAVFLTILNGCWSLTLHMEDARRKGQQRVFAPSPPLLPDWIFYTVYALLLLQLVLSAFGVWRVRTGRWWLAGILLVLWLTAVFLRKPDSDRSKPPHPPAEPSCVTGPLKRLVR
jgi:quinol-cytochrome oxidoreductase complex cytochrome b subunit